MRHWCIGYFVLNLRTGISEKEACTYPFCTLLGKEANNIDEEELELQGAQTFIDEESIKQKILGLTPDEARKVGIAYRGNLKRIQDNIRQTGNINRNARFMRKLVDRLM